MIVGFRAQSSRTVMRLRTPLPESEVASLVIRRYDDAEARAVTTTMQNPAPTLSGRAVQERCHRGTWFVVVAAMTVRTMAALAVMGATSSYETSGVGAT
jgi:hypothetical protein